MTKRWAWRWRGGEAGRERGKHRERCGGEGGVHGGGEGGGERVMGRGRERENWNLKTLFYKDCSSGSFKNLTTSPCYAPDEYISNYRREIEREREAHREKWMGWGETTTARWGEKSGGCGQQQQRV